MTWVYIAILCLSSISLSISLSESDETGNMMGGNGHFVVCEGVVLAERYKIIEKVEPKKRNQSAVIVKTHVSTSRCKFIQILK
jgi:hypothetical protein